MEKPLRFHWSLPQLGDLNEQVRLCETAEQCGIESMLMAIGVDRPDPTLLTIAIGKRTRTIRFMIGCRPGLISPLYFVQQINTASQLIGGRICLYLACDAPLDESKSCGDHLAHDERYERAGEFLTICRALWRGDRDFQFNGRHLRTEHCTVDTPFLSTDGRGPEIFLGGHSAAARTLAVEHADCLWRVPAEPDKMAADIEPVAAAGKEIGLVVSLIARPTTRAAHQAASSLLDNLAMAHAPSGRITPRLWTGAVPCLDLGPAGVALVGSFDEIAAALMTCKQYGITQFLFTGPPDIEEVRLFGGEVLPRVRRLEGSKQNVELRNLELRT